MTPARGTLLLIVGLLLPPPTTAMAQQDTARVNGGPFLYHELGYGSDATFSPLSVVMNLGYEDQQRRNAIRNVFEYPYRSKVKSVWNALSSPLATIERYGGWYTWIGNEILPLGQGTDRAGWWPNYTTHLIGGGLQTRMLTEWYRAKGVPGAPVWAAVNFMAVSFLHEMTQSPGDVGSGSTLADLVVFDLPASILSNWDGPVRFFAVKLQAANWSPMGSIVLGDNEVWNQGDYWVYKIPLPFLDHTPLFWRVGYGAQWGLTHRVRPEYALSWGIGVDTRDRDLDPISLRESITLAFSAGLYLDRNNSLLASVNVSQRQWEPFTVNVYPGVLPGVLRDLGVWGKVDWDGNFRMGVQHRAMMGVGLGLRR